jgi:hypothetical protein
MANSIRLETLSWLKGEMFALYLYLVLIYIVNAQPVDPLVMELFQLEVSEKLP